VQVRQLTDRPTSASINPVAFCQCPIKIRGNPLKDEDLGSCSFSLERANPAVDRSSVPFQRLHQMLGKPEFPSLVRLANVSKALIARI
jgi:hypothetical protein